MRQKMWFFKVSQFFLYFLSWKLGREDHNAVSIFLHDCITSQMVCRKLRRTILFLGKSSCFFVFDFQVRNFETPEAQFKFVVSAIFF